MGSTSERLQRAIIRFTTRAARGNGPPNIDILAIKLSSKYPQSGMTLDEICEEITSQIDRKRSQIDCRKG